MRTLTEVKAEITKFVRSQPDRFLKMLISFTGLLALNSLVDTKSDTISHACV
jgi:hypothetical protein